MARVHKQIVKSYLILCEGIDVENVMCCYLNSAVLADDAHFSNDIQTFNFGGVEDLPVYMQNLTKMDGYDLVRRIMVLRDAETNVQKAISMVQRAFRINGLPVPGSVHCWEKGYDSHGQSISTAFSLLPTCDSNPTEGALEDLCWEILKDQHARKMREDVQGFIEDIKHKYGTVSTHEHKSRLHTYFSVNERFISLKIGEAAAAGAFEWNSEKLKELKKLISEGFSN